MKIGRIFMPDATLDFIIDQLGGTVTRELEFGQRVTVINLRGRRYTGDNQTKLLTDIFAEVLSELDDKDD
jgi:hypothetical protein